MFRPVLAFLLSVVSLPAFAAPCAGFDDVNDTSPFCANVAWVKNRGVTLGCAAGLFCPNDPVSRLSIAAFLNRLGDAVLPPSVLWVASTGGTFQSIQAAINYAFTIASQNNPVLIKVAPGTYQEAITLVPHVRLEGSGESFTVIQPDTCRPERPGAVVMANNSHFKNATVRASQCAAGILFDAGSASNVSSHDSVVRDVTILGAPNAGIWFRGAVSPVGPIERVTMNLQPGLGEIYGVFADLGPSFTLSQVRMLVAGSTAVGIRVNGGGNVELSDVHISALGTSSSANHFGVDLAFGDAHIRNSFIYTLGTGVRKTGGGSALITNTGIRGVLSTVSGTGITCLFTYEPFMHVPLAC